jgi:hypothetical protein
MLFARVRSGLLLTVLRLSSRAEGGRTFFSSEFMVGMVMLGLLGLRGRQVRENQPLSIR